MSKSRSRKRKKTKRLSFDKMRAHGSKSKVIDVPFSRKRSHGTRATKGHIDFHYQKYANMIHFFNTIALKNLDRTFINIELICINNKITPVYDKTLKINKYKNFQVFIINISTNEGNHANTAILNNKNETIEFFEPHGHRKNKNSGIADFNGLYLKKAQVLRGIFLKLVPGYKFINVVDYKRMSSFQTQIDPDENTGYCITWCVLFIHYRCLNPNLLLSRLINHLSSKITTSKLLKYAKFIEETIKK